jgi:hypothetical protein
MSKPTYSYSEALSLIEKADTRQELSRICDLLEEEKKRYSALDLILLGILTHAKERAFDFKNL